MVQNFDKNDKFTIDEYFDSMDLSTKQKEERKQFAKDVEEALFFLIMFIKINSRYSVSRQRMIDMFLSRIDFWPIETYYYGDPYMQDYFKNTAGDLIDSTYKNIDSVYYTSEQRAINIAVNIANTIYNYVDFRRNVEGDNPEKIIYTKKQWVTQKDEKVRFTHAILDDKIISIEDLFLVGNSLMRFPMDMAYNPDLQEVINCRCTIKYLN